ncbi:hypothetical protein HPHPH1_1543 [Helicobacter pylori Hp H-1]|uniref:Uncharacterized protein n=1 Tax=Helicobacter pylori Hp H-1 TaxID=992058 RepID=M7RW43_HELPX|nr:hypothetical protein HPHPH1_1543 [Helicobacter pylori Hp H-1]
MLSFQRSFALNSYPCKVSSGFLKALAKTRKWKYSHIKLKVCLNLWNVWENILIF